MEEREISDQLDCIFEMSTDSAAGLVPIDPASISEITAGDDDPRFATFVIESGWSKSQRYWGPELFQNIAEQINRTDEPLVGYLGHIKPEDDAFVFPEIQMQWLKGKVIQSGENAKLAVKAYVLPNTKARDYIRRGIARTVSWYGKAAQVPFGKGVRVTGFKIESIDLARPRKAGMSAALVGGLTSEMEENTVKPEEIAALQENELRAHNPGLVKGIEDAVRTPLETRVSEMETKTKDADTTFAEIRKALGLSEDAEILDVIKGMASSMRAAARQVREALLDSVIEKKLGKDNAFAAKMVKVALVGEMESQGIKGTEDSKADDERLVSEMVNSFIDKDDDLKKIVSEMEQNPPSPPESSGTEGGGAEYKDGYKSSSLRVRAAS